MTTKSESVRHQRPFEEHMKTLHQNIDNLVYAAEQHCLTDEDGSGCYCGCPFYCQVFHRDEPYEDDCLLPKLREILGEHTEQHNIQIPEDNTQADRKAQRSTKYCDPCQRTEPECNPCKGRV